MGTPLTDADLGAIWRRCEAASPGPWELELNCDGEANWLCGPDNIVLRPEIEVLGYEQQREYITGDATDFVFICAARTDIPALLAEIDALREDVRYYSNACDRLAKYPCSRDDEFERLRKENQELIAERRDLERVIAELKAEVARHAK